MIFLIKRISKAILKWLKRKIFLKKKCGGRIKETYAKGRGPEKI